MARTCDTSAYINNLLLGARGARILQPAPTPPSSSFFTKEMFTITSPLYRMLPPSPCTQLPGSLWSLCSEQTWAFKPAILGVGLALSLPWYWPLVGPSWASPSGAVLSPVSLGVPLGRIGQPASPASASSPGAAVGSVWSPLSSLAPVFGSEVQTLGVNSKEPLEHSPLMPIHDVL